MISGDLREIFLISLTVCRSIYAFRGPWMSHRQGRKSGCPFTESRPTPATYGVKDLPITGRLIPAHDSTRFAVGWGKVCPPFRKKAKANTHTRMIRWSASVMLET